VRGGDYAFTMDDSDESVVPILAEVGKAIFPYFW
jgi:hypothetical protein